LVGRAAEQDRSHALELDPESVTPSVGLLQEMLSPRCGLPPDRLAQMRRLVDGAVGDLVRELTSRLRPAPTGGVVARPTSRPARPRSTCPARSPAACARPTSARTGRCGPRPIGW
jgi:hypothetical protein